MDAPEPRSGDTNDFFLITAHEMRTSLSAMKWLFDMLEKGDFGILTTEQHDVIKRACDTNERLIALVNDVMTVVKNDAADVRYVFAPCNLGHMVSAAVKDFASAANHKHIHLSFTEPTEPILVSADEARIRVVIDNLIENAIKYGSNETGVIISLASDQTNATFSVQNSGIGIPETDQERIFQNSSVPQIQASISVQGLDSMPPSKLLNGTKVRFHLLEPKGLEQYLPSPSPASQTLPANPRW